MTRCPSAEQLAELAAGLAPQPARDALAGHVDSCSDCRAQLADLAGTWEQLDGWQVAEPRGGLAAEFRLLLEAEPDTVAAPRQGRWASPRVWISLAAALALAIVLPAVFLGGGSSAGLTAVEGSIEVRDSDIEPWRKATEVRAGQSVRARQAASLTTADHSRLQLAAGSLGRLLPAGAGERLHWYVDAGQAEFDVSPDAQAFVVETGGGQVRVVGTYFGVEASAARPNTLVAWVRTGEVEVTNRAGKATLTAGQCVSCPATADPVQSRFAAGGMVFVRNEHHPTVAFLARVQSTSAAGVTVLARGHRRQVPYDQVFARPVVRGLRVQVAQPGRPMRTATVVRVVGETVEVETADSLHPFRVELSAVHIEVDSK